MLIKFFLKYCINSKLIEITNKCKNLHNKLDNNYKYYFGSYKLIIIVCFKHIIYDLEFNITKFRFKV